MGKEQLTIITHKNKLYYSGDLIAILRSNHSKFDAVL